MFKRILLAGTLALAANSPGNAAQQSMMEHIQMEIRPYFKDPASVQFQAMHLGHDSGGFLWACGWANARNEFGGYAGNRAFAVVISIDGHLGASPMFQMEGVSPIQQRADADFLLSLCAGGGSHGTER